MLKPKSKSSVGGSRSIPPEEVSFQVVLSESSAQVHLALTVYKGRTYVDIRRFYEAGGVWKPTPKGISIPVEDFEAIYRKLRRLKKHLDEGV